MTVKTIVVDAYLLEKEGNIPGPIKDIVNENEPVFIIIRYSDHKAFNHYDRVAKAKENIENKTIKITVFYSSVEEFNEKFGKLREQYSLKNNNILYITGSVKNKMINEKCGYQVKLFANLSCSGEGSNLLQRKNIY